jgi:hypothetical protein
MWHDAATKFLASSSSQNGLSYQAAASVEYNRTNIFSIGPPFAAGLVF